LNGVDFYQFSGVLSTLISPLHQKMQTFSIRDMERMTGVKAHTLRVWEHRYGLALPHRKDSQHRFYTNEDLQKILRVAWLYEKGYKISRIASLNDDALSAMIQEAVHSGNGHQKTIESLLHASQQFDGDLFSELLHKAILHLGMEETVQQVIYPYLEKIGLLWMNDSVMPAQEHFSSQFIMHAFIASIDALPRPANVQPPILLFGPEEEYHEIPLLFIEYLLRKKGNRVVNLGPNTPDAAVEEFCGRKPFSQLHYHQVTNFTRYDAEELLEKWCLQYPTKRVVMSGRLTKAIEKPLPNAQLLGSIDDLLKYANHPFAELQR
jgi:DNA-binding transcriptional MerR regulator